MSQESERPRARELGIEVGVFPTGTNNAITDVAGVRVGHSTIVRTPDVRTGVTAIVPHSGNPYTSRVPAAMHVAAAERIHHHLIPALSGLLCPAAGWSISVQRSVRQSDDETPAFPVCDR